MSDYLRRLTWFRDFIASRRLRATSTEDLDAVIAGWFDVLFRRGHTSKDGAKFLAGLQHFMLGLKTQSD